MPDPSYRPRDYLVYPKKFGTDDKPELLTQDVLEHRARALAASWQSRHANTARRLLIERNVTRKGLAEGTGIRYQRLTRLLTGEIVMRVEDLMRLRLFFERHTEEEEDFSLRIALACRQCSGRQPPYERKHC